MGGDGGGEGSPEKAAAEEGEWGEAAEAVAYDSCTWPPPVAVVCGPGNSGKSAFSRRLLNTLLRRYKKVGFLDIDVGQPEFTPPGFVSLHVLEKETKDLTMLYLQTPMRCFFFGDVCAQKNPILLLSYIFGLYDYFLKEFYQYDEVDSPDKSALPLVVNTSGWVKGIGLDVLSDVLRYVSPTHVVKLQTSRDDKNLPSGKFWLDENSGESLVNLIEICATPDSPVHLISIKKEARIIRDLRLIAYFRQCLPRDLSILSYNDLIQSFVSICPFQLPLSKIQVIDLHCEVSANVEYHCLNGSIVGLAISTSVPLSAECSTPWCCGLGFVKAVDVLGDRIHLISPVRRQHLEKVDVVLRSSIAVPACLLQASDPTIILTDKLREL